MIQKSPQTLNICSDFHPRPPLFRLCRGLFVLFFVPLPGSTRNCVGIQGINIKRRRCFNKRRRCFNKRRRRFIKRRRRFNKRRRRFNSVP